LSYLSTTTGFEESRFHERLFSLSKKPAFPAQRRKRKQAFWNGCDGQPKRKLNMMAVLSRLRLFSNLLHLSYVA
jgi:hypothetical protein